MTAEIHHCQECVDLLGEYIEGTLPEDRAKALEDHLSLCPPCITFVRTYKATRKLCRHAMNRDMPQELRRSLSSFLAERVPGFKCADDETMAPSPADTAPKKV